MLFQTPIFFVFFAGVILAMRMAGSRGARHWILLLASYVFYAAWDVRFLSLLLLSTLVDHVAGARIGASIDGMARRRWLVLSICTNLGILSVFKYFNFFVGSAVDLALVFGVELSRPTLSIVLPVGISFYTFQSMSYTIDIYRGVLRPEKSLLRFALFVAFFPQLVAGPIVRARHFLPQLERDLPPSIRNLPSGAMLFSVGLFKKIAIADNLAKVADPVFAVPELFGSGYLVLAVLAYAGQIYCDFSGYSDMAIGIGRILGYRLPRNFNRPYAAVSPQELWTRWHISLSSWLRDYLYIPLGGSRGSTSKTYRNLMLTMLLGGLWHGAAWTFVVWGFIHGLALAMHRMARAAGLTVRGVFGTGFGWALTLLTTLFAWVFFRSPTLGDAAVYLKGIVDPSPGLEIVATIPVTLVCGLLAIVAIEQSNLGMRLERRCRRWPDGVKMLVAGMLITFAYTISPGIDRAFIYFQF